MEKGRKYTRRAFLKGLTKIMCGAILLVNLPASILGRVPVIVENNLDLLEQIIEKVKAHESAIKNLEATYIILNQIKENDKVIKEKNLEVRFVKKGEKLFYQEKEVNQLEPRCIKIFDGKKFYDYKTTTLKDGSLYRKCIIRGKNDINNNFFSTREYPLLKFSHWVGNQWLSVFIEPVDWPPKKLSLAYKETHQPAGYLLQKSFLDIQRDKGKCLIKKKTVWEYEKKPNEYFDTCEYVLWLDSSKNYSLTELQYFEGGALDWEIKVTKFVNKPNANIWLAAEAYLIYYFNTGWCPESGGKRRLILVGLRLNFESKQKEDKPMKNNKKAKRQDCTTPEVEGQEKETLEMQIRGKIREWIVEMVEEELSAVLSAGRHVRSEGRRGYRNGRRKRTFTSSVGHYELELPRGYIFGEDGKKKEWHGLYCRSLPSLIIMEQSG